MKQRGPIWLKTETKAMLNLIKDHNLLKYSLSDFQLIQTLTKLMQQRGYDRTPIQVRMKLKSLEGSYFACKKRGFDSVVLKQFAHYTILNELFSKKRRKDEDIDTGMITDTDYNDDNTNIWLAEEIQIMMSIIEESNLAEDLRDGFSLFALKVISEELNKAGFDKDVEQVETALTSLKMTYKKTKESLKNDIHTEVCPYFEYLQKLWGPTDNPLNKNNNNNDKNLPDEIKPHTSTSEDNVKLPDNQITINGHVNNTSVDKKDSSSNSKWSEEETLVLLSLIEETDIFDEFIHKLSNLTTMKLIKSFTEHGYKRSIDEVTNKLQHLRDTYLRSFLNGQKKVNEHHNSQYMIKIDNMLVVKKVDVDKALKALDNKYKIDYKLRDEHNYVNTDKYNQRDEPLSVPMNTDQDDDVEVSKPPSIKSPDNKNENNSNINLKKANISNKDEDNSNSVIQPTSSESQTSTRTDQSVNSPKPRTTIEPEQNDVVIKPSESYNDQSNEFLKIMSTPLPTKLIKIINRDPAIIVERISSSEPPGLVLIPQTSNAVTQNANNTNSQPQYTTANAAKSNPQKIITTKSKVVSQPTPTTSKSIPVLQILPTKTVPEPTSSTKSLPSCSNVVSLSSNTPVSTLDLIFKHEEQMQQQHHQWMEQQFEIQRKYDRDQRAILLSELRELRKVFTQAVSKKNLLSNLNS